MNCHLKSISSYVVQLSKQPHMHTYNNRLTIIIIVYFIGLLNRSTHRLSQFISNYNLDIFINLLTLIRRILHSSMLE